MELVTGPRIITSPLTATGTFNSSFSYTLTAIRQLQYIQPGILWPASGLGLQ